MRVLIPLPTTGASRRIPKITARRDLGASAVYLHGTTRLSRITKDYDSLISKEGPATALAPLVKPGPYWLFLSDEIEAGESWKVPVLLAHVVTALGAELVDEPDKADLVVWSTGAVDAELNVVDHDYHVPEKVEHSRDELREAAAAGAQIIGILPARTDPAPLHKVLADIDATGSRVERINNIDAARRVLEPVLRPEIAPPHRHIPVPSAAIALIAAAALAVVAFAVGPAWFKQTAGQIQTFMTAVWIGGVGLGDRGPRRDATPGLHETPEEQPPGAAKEAGNQPQDDGHAPIGPAVSIPASPLQLTELRDPNGRHCVFVLQDHRPPHRDDVPLEGRDRFRDTAGRRLCALEWTLKGTEAARSGIQSFDVDIAEGNGVTVIRTPREAPTRIMIEFRQESPRPLTYNVRLKFAGQPSPEQVQQFQHTISPFASGWRPE